MHETRSPSPRLRLPSTRAAGAAAAGARSTARHDRGPVAERSADADQLLVVDIETVPDESLLPPADDWPRDRFPKNAWHAVVAVSFVQADILRDAETGLEEYRVTACRSGGEAGWDEARILRGFWRHFASGAFRLVTWNGRGFDMPTMLHRTMLHGISAEAWFRRGTRWSGYGNRYGGAHVDLMDEMSGFGCASRLTLEEAAALVGMPGKLGEHGSLVADMVAAGQIERVRAYCETDTITTFGIYVRHAYLAGRTDAAGHDRAIAGLQDYLELERTRRPHLGAYLDAWRRRSDTRSTFVADGDRRGG
jgi:hypothetical protein